MIKALPPWELSLWKDQRRRNQKPSLSHRLSLRGVTIYQGKNIRNHQFHSWYLFLCHLQGLIMDLRKGLEGFFLEGIKGCFAGCTVDFVVSFRSPEIGFAFHLLKVFKGVASKEVLDIPDDPFNASFFIGSSRGAGMDGEAVMGCKIEELGVECELGGSANDHTF